MNKRAICAVCFLALITMMNVTQSCAEAQSRFEVLSLEITPTKVITGEKATIAVEIRNNDSQSVTYNVPLIVNGVADDRKSLRLAPGTKELVSFTLTRSQAGTYTISIGSRESTLVVEEPLLADFRLSNLEINPTEVNTGENVVVTANLVNAGGTQGSYTAELKINGVTEQSEELIIPAGADYMLVFKISKDLPGTYVVTLGDLSDWYVVNELSTPENVSPPCPPSGGCGPGG